MTNGTGWEPSSKGEHARELLFSSPQKEIILTQVAILYLMIAEHI
jgi:hypothetical protein